MLTSPERLDTRRAATTVETRENDSRKSWSSRLSRARFAPLRERGCHEVLLVS